MIEVGKAVSPGGFLYDWLRLVEPFESPDSYCLFSLLAVAACAVDRRIVVNPEGEPEVFTNMYVLLIGPSGSRKGSAIKYATQVLHDAVEHAPILPRSFTVSGLIEDFAGQSAQKGYCSGLLTSDEFSRVIGGPEYQQDNFGFLTEMWDCPETHPRRTRSHGYEEIRQPYLTILGASAPDWLEQVNPKVLTGGALRRLMTIVEFRAKRHASRPIRDKALAARLTGLFKERLGPGAFGGTFMRLDEEAWEVKDQWYHNVVQKILAGSNEKESHFASCMEAHAIKTAALVHLLEGGVPNVLSGESLRTGQKLVEAILPPMFQTYASLVPTPFARLRSGIIRALQIHGGIMEEIRLDRHLAETLGAAPREREVAKASLLREGIARRTEQGAITID